MHCLNPRKITNPRFNEQTEQGAQNLSDYRRKYRRKWPPDYKIEIPCGLCSGCLRDKATQWRVRLIHEARYGNHYPIRCLTLTISNENLQKFETREMASREFRSFLDRLRYYTPDRKTPKHWFCSELGEERGRLHFHGFLFGCDVSCDIISRCWTSGFSAVRDLRSERQLSYAASYITKTGRWHKSYVFTSPGLGKSYLLTHWAKSHRLGTANQSLDFSVRIGDFRYTMPPYYRAKVFNQFELDGFKIELSESDRPFEKFLAGSKYTDEQSFLEARKQVFQRSVALGYSKEAKPKIAPILAYNPYAEDGAKSYEFTDDLYPF